MNIEVISSQNLKQLVELVLELWNDCSFDEEVESYKAIIDSENEICYVVKDQEDYIAFVHLSTRNDYVEGAEDLPVAYIEAIYVKPAYQKQGIARRLTKVAEDWAKQKGFKQIASDTDLWNSASIDFHQKTGFTEVERIVCFIKNL
ncbi:aminoglycoside 6'-N-acetyltransferase [Flavobacterium sp. B183]|uniref:aminoglycoside 6'-N-acetyltransferase n=1 Tax=Flavobacterium sp. B183 TaxID=907046 RepID=UPI00201F8653|nr:aminoglycoside 6'-N-acetyltransferase [Flavobacterium sp. B183]URC14887.1 GNAT family N-acetyltransferase [Flavobacterium sp. B183]